jgi:Restriction endonuclease
MAQLAAPDRGSKTQNSSMPIHSSCPRCQALLLLPEGCEGLPTRCPNCLAEFTIAGTAGGPSAAMVCAVMTPVAGRIGQHDLEQAKLKLAELTTANVGARLELERYKRRKRRQARRISILEFFQSSREVLDHSFGRIGGFFITIVAAPALLVLAASLVSPSAIGILLVIALGMATAACVYAFVAFYPDDDALARAIPGLLERLRDTTIRHDELAADEAAQRERIAVAEHDFRRIKEALESRLHWLRTCQWPQMTGRGFANFLALALEEHGYAAEIVGGNPGLKIDLVASRDGRRVAVRARGDAASAVDADAIAEAEAAMRARDCSSAAVITNSRFTAAARELAERTRCKIIDAGQIPDLIEGRVML